MSTLDFTRVDAAVAEGSFRPVARSPLERRLRAADAIFEERDGWLVPVSVPDETNRLASVGVADISYLAKLELRPAGEPIQGDGIVWYPISLRRALLLCAPALSARAREQAGDRLVLDVTGSLAVIAFTGPEAGTVLRRITHLHRFPRGGEVAHVTAHVLERGGGYWIVVAQELGEHMLDVVLDRAEALGGGLVGVDALGGRP